MTHVECYLDWPRMEPDKDVWNTSDFDQLLVLSSKYNLKMLVLPCLCNPPAWVKSSSMFTPVLDSVTSEPANYFSPWAPGTYEAYDHFFSSLSARYKDKIDIVKFPIEIGLLVSLEIGRISYHKGLWCGDQYARADFREQMLAKYHSIARLNSAWGTHFGSPADLEYPDQANRMNEQRRWVDFLTWYQDSQTRAMVRELKIIRKYFPTALIDIPMGFGEDTQTDGVDRTSVCVAAAPFQPVSIRSTHSGFNRNPYPQAYWFYKRMAPTAHRVGIGFSTEPPGGDFSYAEAECSVFESASAGANLIFQYYQNYHKTPAPGLKPHIIEDYKAALRPGEPSLVDVGVLFPSTQMMLDLNGGVGGWDQFKFCAAGRSYFDYDIVDENMIGWNQLARYKVLLHTSGTIYRDATFPAVEKWLAQGGVLVTRGLPVWRDLSGRETNSWMRREVPAAAGVREFRVGKGTIYAIDATDTTAYLAQVVKVLSAGAPLRGFKPVDGGTWITEFADGKLVCDSKTFETKFVVAPAP